MYIRLFAAILVGMPASAMALEFDCSLSAGTGFSRTDSVWSESEVGDTDFTFSVMVEDGGPTLMIEKDAAGADKGEPVACAPFAGSTAICSVEGMAVIVVNLTAGSFAMLETEGLAQGTMNDGTLVGVGNCAQAG